LEAAEAQLERALTLYLNGTDYLSAITLAGAAEEPLGKMLERSGGKHSLHSESSAMAVVHLHLFDEELEKKDAISHINIVRDWLKHFRDGSDLEFDAKDKACEIIDRAIGNFVRLTGKESNQMQRFMELQRAND
jgi:hypothetical protein